jgi:hypothetical protein
MNRYVSHAYSFFLMNHYVSHAYSFFLMNRYVSHAYSFFLMNRYVSHAYSFFLMNHYVSHAYSFFLMNHYVSHAYSFFLMKALHYQFHTYAMLESKFSPGSHPYTRVATHCITNRLSFGALIFVLSKVSLNNSQMYSFNWKSRNLIVTLPWRKVQMV